MWYKRWQFTSVKSLDENKRPSEFIEMVQTLRETLDQMDGILKVLSCVSELIKRLRIILGKIRDQPLYKKVSNSARTSCFCDEAQKRPKGEDRDQIFKPLIKSLLNPANCPDFYSVFSCHISHRHICFFCRRSFVSHISICIILRKKT